MLSLLKKIAHDNGFLVEDFLEVEKRRLLNCGEIPEASTHHKLLGTIHYFCVRFSDLLIKRYGTLESAIAAGKEGSAFVAQAIRGRDNDHGGMSGLIQRDAPKAAFSHVKIAEARKRMEEMGVVIHDSNGRGNVGYTRINVPSLLVLAALTEDLLGMSPANTDNARAIADQTYSGFTEEEMEGFTEQIEEQIEQPDYAVPAIAKVMKSRCNQFFGFNLRSKDREYVYPVGLEQIIQESWAAIATVANPVVNIPAEFLDETIKYCKERAKATIKRAKYIARTLENELAYQADIECPY